MDFAHIPPKAAWPVVVNYHDLEPQKIMQKNGWTDHEAWRKYNGGLADAAAEAKGAILGYPEMAFEIESMLPKRGTQTV